MIMSRSGAREARKVKRSLKQAGVDEKAKKRAENDARQAVKAAGCSGKAKLTKATACAGRVMTACSSHQVHGSHRQRVPR